MLVIVIVFVLLHLKDIRGVQPQVFFYADAAFLGLFLYGFEPVWVAFDRFHDGADGFLLLYAAVGIELQGGLGKAAHVVEQVVGGVECDHDVGLFQGFIRAIELVEVFPVQLGS